ncbi:hypothetical protein M0811_08283 [Anaeramoeba ignava]|uniref:AAA+ ATPase domain-containing protein n=1 Tax=Anaeramoeba ignava TaxID=1746090 RepID=A0A9Q0RB40_ANAIG|nr:hypothetical protein M0811_08283 [Anaeramoeba ignava]
MHYVLLITIDKIIFNTLTKNLLEKKTSKKNLTLNIIIDQIQDNLVNYLRVREYDNLIAVNQILKENLLLVFISCYVQIPLFIVGKPGTSKTLSIEIILHRLRQGSDNLLIQAFKLSPLVPFYLQCSKILSSKGISRIFKLARESKKHIRSEIIPVVILDEVALAEFSPDLPLKVLHSELEFSDRKYLNQFMKKPNFSTKKGFDKKKNFRKVRFSIEKYDNNNNNNNNDNINISGIEKEKEDQEIISVIVVSNWKIDPANTNRSILLCKQDPSPKDIKETTELILQSQNLQNQVDEKPALFYNLITKKQTQKNQNQNQLIYRHYYGLRDFYYLLRMSIKATLKFQKIYSNTNVFWNEVYRNFGSKPTFLGEIRKTFSEENGFPLPSKEFSSMKMVQQNIHGNLLPKEGGRRYHLEKDEVHLYSRHLMVLIDSLAFFPVFLQQIKSKKVIIFSSFFPKESKRIKIIQNLKQVEKSVSLGETIVLYNNNQLFEPLYDLLNQNYIKIENKLYTRISFEDESRFVFINPGFRIIVITTKIRAYEKESPAVLNRFEKQLIESKDLISNDEAKIFLKEQDNILSIIEKMPDSKIKREHFIINYHNDFLPSLAIKFQNKLKKMKNIYHESNQETIPTNQKIIEEDMNKCCMRLCRAESVIEIQQIYNQKKEVNNEDEKIQNLLNYGLQLSSKGFANLFTKELEPRKIHNSIILTYSPINEKIIYPQNSKTQSINLSEFQNEDALKKRLSDKWFKKSKIKRKNTKTIFIIHFDISQSSEQMFYQSRYLIENMIQKFLQEENIKEEESTKRKISNENKKKHYFFEKQQFYVVFIVHLPLTLITKTFFYCFDDIWEYYYLEELSPKIDIDLKIGNINQNLSIETLIKNVKDQIPAILKNSITFSISKFLRPDNKYYAELINLTSGLLDNKNFVQSMINSFIKASKEKKNESNKLYQWNIVEIIKEKKERKRRDGTFISYITDEFFSKIIRIFAIFLSSFDRNYNLHLFREEQKYILDVWINISKNFSIHFYPLFETDYTFKAQFPFSNYIYLSIQEILIKQQKKQQ